MNIYIYVIAGILGITVIVLAWLLIKEIQQKNFYKCKYEEQDKMVTQYVSEYLDMKKELMDMKLDYNKQQDMAKEIRRTQEQIRSLKHDMKNHTFVILSYLEENKTEEAKYYAGKIMDKLNKMYTYVHMGNSLLNHIINNKLSYAKEQGIEIKAEIENLAFAYMESVDFSALLNNILDNAISGALSSKEKKLEVQIFLQKGFDVIIVKNSIDKSVLSHNPQFVSTKNESGHGYGIKQMKNIAEKYNGNLDIYEKNNMFIVSVMLG